LKIKRLKDQGKNFIRSPEEEKRRQEKPKEKVWKETGKSKDAEERTQSQIRTARKIRYPKKKESLDLNSAK